MADYSGSVFGELPPDRQELFESIPGVDYFESDDEQSIAESFFAIGWGFKASEYESMGIDKYSVEAARQEFLDWMQLDEDSFPWDEWREIMGYDD